MPIPVQRTTTYPSGIHRFLAYNTSNTNFEAFCSSEPKEILKITNERIYTSNITVLGNIEFGADTGILSTRLQVNPARKVFYVDSSTQSIFTLSVDGIFGGYASNADVCVNQNKLSYLNSNYADYDLTYAFTTGSNTDYTVTLTQAAVFGDMVDITLWPQLIQQSTPLSGYVYQGVSFTYFNKTTPTGSDIYYLGNVGIGTGTPTQKLNVQGDTLLNGNLTVTGCNLYITNGGVGIGTTTSATVSQLAVNAETRLYKDITLSDRVDLGGYYDGGMRIRGVVDLAYDGENISRGGSKGHRGIEWYYANNNRWGMVQDSLYNLALYTSSTVVISEEGSAITFNKTNTVDNTSTTAFSEFGRFNYQGYLGIGTTRPTQKLHVQGNAIVTGNVGIGTVTPTQQLHVQGSALINGNLTVTGSNITNINYINSIEYNSSNVIINNVSGAGPALKVSQTGVGASYPIADFYDNDVSTTIPVLRIADGGNVGIGTTSPQATLYVHGDISIFRESKIQFAVGSETRAYIKSNGTNNALEFGSAGVETMRIMPSTASVGIGTTAPTEKLHVIGNIKATGYMYAPNAIINKQVYYAYNAAAHINDLTTSTLTYSGIFVTITPKFTNSKFVIKYTSSMFYTNGSTDIAAFIYRRVNAGANANLSGGNQQTRGTYLPLVLVAIDTPTFTLGSTLTYTIWSASITNGQRSILVHNNTVAILEVEEVAQ